MTKYFFVSYCVCVMKIKVLCVVCVCVCDGNIFLCVFVSCDEKYFFVTLLHV